MPNWCKTFYKISGPEKHLRSLNDTIKKLSEGESLLPNDFGPLWLGNLVSVLGGDWNEVYCRRIITDWEIQPEGLLYISVESAWHEMGQVRSFLLQKFPGIQILYYSEELFNEYFVTNDAAWLEKNRWYIESSTIKIDMPREHYPTLEVVVEDIKAVFKPATPPEATFKSIQNFFRKWMNENDDDFIQLYEFKLQK